MFARPKSTDVSIFCPAKTAPDNVITGLIPPVAAIALHSPVHDAVESLVATSVGVRAPSLIVNTPVAVEKTEAELTREMKASINIVRMK
jgi:hypothetical protein